MAEVISARVGEDLLARVDAARGEDTRGAWLLRLINRQLSGQQATPAPASPSLAAIGTGEPSPGVLCMGPGCWERNTSKFGLRRLPLCPACAAALIGEVYVRPGAERARALSKTAA